MPVMKTNCLLSYVTDMQLRVKIKYEKNVGNVLKYVSEQTISSLNTVEGGK